MDDIINWPIIKQLSEDFVATIKFVYIFNDGKSIICVCNDDNIYSYGDNSYGYLGLGHTFLVDSRPIQISELSNKQVCDIKFSCSSLIELTKTGHIYSWGSNIYGQIGNGSKDNCLKSVVINALIDEQVIDVECGHNHCLALTLNGEVFEWGWSVSDNHNTVPIKVIVSATHKITSISCGAYYSLVLTDNGEVYVWGQNTSGQCGNGNNDNQLNPIKINTMFEKIKKISCGPYHSLLLSENEDIFAFGSNSCIQLGDGSKINNNIPLKIDISTKFVNILAHDKNQYNISIGLSKDGFCYVWGECGKQSLTKPIKTMFKSVDEALAHYSNVKITYKPYYIKPKYEKIPVLSRIANSFNVPEMSDIKFKIDGNFIHVQSNYLRMVCKHFDTMFAPNVWLESNSKEIEITQYSYAVYYSFLKYLYTNSVDIESKQLIELYYLADSYLEDHLKQKCIEIMKNDTKIDNVFNYWSFAVENNLSELENFFFDFMKTRIKEVIKTDSYIQMNDINIHQKLFECFISQ